MYLTPWIKIYIFLKLELPQLVNKFPTPYGTRMNITPFTTASYLFIF